MLYESDIKVDQTQIASSSSIWDQLTGIHQAKKDKTVSYNVRMLPY